MLKDSFFPSQPDLALIIVVYYFVPALAKWLVLALIHYLLLIFVPYAMVPRNHTQFPSNTVSFLSLPSRRVKSDITNQLFILLSVSSFLEKCLMHWRVPEQVINWYLFKESIKILIAKRERCVERAQHITDLEMLSYVAIAYLTSLFHAWQIETISYSNLVTRKIDSRAYGKIPT